MAFEPINPLPGRPGFFGAFRTASVEQSTAALREAISKSITRKNHSPVCTRCNGRGYQPYERVGCDQCHGLGVIP